MKFLDLGSFIFRFISCFLFVLLVPLYCYIVSHCETVLQYAYPFG